MIYNGKSEELHSRITNLRQKQILSHSQEEKQLLEEEINDLKEQVRKLNRKEPVVTVIKDATTVGDSIERKLANKGHTGRSSFGRSSVII